jgi:hypothetical protein
MTAYRTPNKTDKQNAEMASLDDRFNDLISMISLSSLALIGKEE